MNATIHSKPLLFIPFLLVVLCGVATAESPKTGDRFAVMTDIGVPDGFMASLLAKSSGHTRIHAGIGHNAVSMGVRGGVQLHARSRGNSPFLAFELGHYFDGEAQPWLQSMASGAGLDGDRLERFSYAFYTASIGLRLGSPSAAFFFQAGASYISGAVHLRESRGTPASMSPSVDVFTRTNVRVWSPAARVGLLAYF